jgi:hypothetical protein
MFSRIIRPAAIVAASVVLAVMVWGCSSDNNIAPTASNNEAYSSARVGPRVSLGNTELSDSGAPANGIVVEGASVPGIALGFTRAQVEAAYGEPVWCQNVNGYDQGACAFPVEGGGQVDVRYRGSDGGPANNSPDDVVHFITWYESVPGWVTTAGITTTLAADNPDTVIAAYPEGQVTYNSFGGLYSVIDYQQGIKVIWAPDFYHGTVNVHMSIMYPTDPPPPPENLLRVTDIDLTSSKVRGKRRIQAFVRVENESGRSMAGAAVSALWGFPDGNTLADDATTSNSGNAYFEIVDVPRGTYNFSIENVVLEDYTFDSDNSVLNASIYVK